MGRLLRAAPTPHHGRRRFVLALETMYVSLLIILKFNNLFFVFFLTPDALYIKNDGRYGSMDDEWVKAQSWFILKFT